MSRRSQERSALETRVLAAMLLAIGVFVSCASSRPWVPQAAPVEASLPVLGPGDVFEVRVYGEEDLSGTYRVGSDGAINFPLVGKVLVQDKTASQVSDAISAKLEKYIREPSVSVLVKQYTSKKVYVMGHVRKPGTFPYEDGMNIIQAITLAGGFAELANENGTFVTRVIEGEEQRIEAPVKAIGEGKTPNLQLEPGDIVYVPESMF